MNYKYIIFLLIAASLCACNNKPNNSYTKLLDSLNTVLKVTDSIYNKIDWQKATEIESTGNANIITIEASKKKLNNKNKNLLDAYKQLLAFGAMDSAMQQSNAFDQKQNRKFLRKQIDYSFSQLKNLLADVESNSLKDDKIKEYLKTESKAIEELHKFTTQKLDVYNKCFSQFEILKPQIDELLNTQK